MKNGLRLACSFTPRRGTFLYYKTLQPSPKAAQSEHFPNAPILRAARDRSLDAQTTVALRPDCVVQSQCIFASAHGRKQTNGARVARCVLRLASQYATRDTQPTTCLRPRVLGCLHLIGEVRCAGDKPKQGGQLTALLQSVREGFTCQNASGWPALQRAPPGQCQRERP